MLWAVVQSFAESATQGSGWQERLEGIKDLLEGDDLLVLLADGLEHHCVRPLAQLLHHVVLAEHVLYGAVSGRSSVRRALQSEGDLGVRGGVCSSPRSTRHCQNAHLVDCLDRGHPGLASAGLSPASSAEQGAPLFGHTRR